MLQGGPTSSKYYVSDGVLIPTRGFVNTKGAWAIIISSPFHLICGGMVDLFLSQIHFLLCFLGKRGEDRPETDPQEIVNKDDGGGIYVEQGVPTVQVVPSRILEDWMAFDPLNIALLFATHPGAAFNIVEDLGSGTRGSVATVKNN